MEEDIKKMREMAEKVGVRAKYLEDPFRRLSEGFANSSWVVPSERPVDKRLVTYGYTFGYAPRKQLNMLDNVDSVGDIEKFRMNMLKNSDGADYGVFLFRISNEASTTLNLKPDGRQEETWKENVRRFGIPEPVKIRVGKYNSEYNNKEQGWVVFLFDPIELEKWFLKGKLAYAYDDYFDTVYCFELLKYIADHVEKGGEANLGKTAPSETCKEYIEIHRYIIKKMGEGYTAYR